MTEWKEYKIGDLCDTISDTYKGKDPEVILINTSDVLEGKILNHETVPNENLKGQFKKTFKTDDILYSEIRPGNKRFAYVNVEDTSLYIASTKLMVLRPNTAIVEPRFLFAILSSQSMIDELQVRAESRSGTFPQITFGAELAPMQVQIPDRETQKKIVSFLDSFNGKLENNNQINRNLSEQLDALYDNWFGKYKPFNMGIGGDPNYELEDGWHIEDIYAIADIIYGAPFASKLFNTEGEGKPIVRIRDLKNQELCTYTPEEHPKGYLLQPGDIVVGMDGEFKPYIWGNEEAWLNQRVCVFNNRRGNGKAYVYCTIKPLLYSVEATEVATTVIHIGKKDYDEFRVVLPPEDVLAEFEAISKPMFDQIVEGQLENRRLTKLRDSLLPKLMSGELDVSNLTI